MENIYVLTHFSIHNGIQDYNVVEVSENHDVIKNILNTDYLDTIHNIYDNNNLDYTIEKIGDSLTIVEKKDIYEHYDKWEIVERTVKNHYRIRREFNRNKKEEHHEQ